MPCPSGGPSARLGGLHVCHGVCLSHHMGSGPRSCVSWPLLLSPDVNILQTFSINTILGDTCHRESGVYTPHGQGLLCAVL